MTDSKQSDEALVDVFGPAIYQASRDEKCGLRTQFCGRLIARAILPILAAREASARAEGRREGIEEARKVIQKRMDDRFKEHGTREPDTNATYYEGCAGETYEALDEEADDILTILRALAEKQL